MNNFPALNIAAAAIFSALLYIILKFFRKWNVNNIQGLTFNYLTASILSFQMSRAENLKQLHTASDILPPALLIGLLFIVVFYLTAITAQRSGLAIASIASKMSMAIPILAGIFLFQDKVTVLRIIGVLLALTAVVLSAGGRKEETHSNSKSKFALPALLFIGSGMVDTSIKLSEHYFITDDNINLYFSFLFGTAGCFGVLMLTYKYFREGKKLEFRSLLAGILLGTTNYFSLIFLVKALASEGAESSVIFAIVNMLVVILSMVSGMLIFREKPSSMNLAGLGLSILALFILSR